MLYSGVYNKLFSLWCGLFYHAGCPSSKSNCADLNMHTKIITERSSVTSLYHQYSVAFSRSTVLYMYDTNILPVLHSCGKMSHYTGVYMHTSVNVYSSVWFPLPYSLNFSRVKIFEVQ